MTQNDKLRIFHIGDVHLDSPFSGFDVRVSERRRAEQRAAFLSAIGQVRERSIDIVLISGDLFDCGYVTNDTVKAVMRALGECGVPVVISPGNHDPYSADGVYSKKHLPDNVFVFTGEELTHFDFDELGLCVHGYAFLSNRYRRDPLEGGTPSRGDGFIDVLCAHTELDESVPTFAPIKRDTLAHSPYAYAALGHVHLHSAPEALGAAVASYSGFMFGRSFDELGYGRGLIVEIDRATRRASVETVTLADKRYLIDSLDITGAETPTDVKNAVSSYVLSRGYGEETSLRIRLVGAIPPDLSLPETLDGAPTALLQLKNETTPMFDRGALLSDITLRGAFYSRLLPSLESSDERCRRVAEQALRIGLCALDGKPFMEGN